tara:strand:- start:131 stop:2098 length:1968 start_codon:yes stop_codon:yes gene_type:complete
MNADGKNNPNDPSQEKIKSILDLFNSNKLNDAKKEIDKQLIKYPKSSILFNILGAILSSQNNLKEALSSYIQSIKINPNYAQAYNNLGVCMYKLGKFEESIQNYEKAIKIKPNHPDAYNNLGIAFKELGENQKSIDSYNKAIEIQPNHADAHNNLGTEYRQLKEYKKSIFHYEQTIKINPNSQVAYSNLGNAYKELKEYKKAIDCHQKSIKINPKYADAYYNLGTIFEELKEVEKAISYYSKAIEIQPDHHNANTNILFNTCWSNKGEKYLEIAKKYYELIPKYNENKFINYEATSQKVLRIGFISGDFRKHPVYFFLLDTIKNLKKKEIKLFAYSNSTHEDDFTKLIKQHFDSWNIVFYETDKNLINLIRKDNIDILFDLSGHTANNRLAIFKNRCAPVQATWCGWLASTGIKEIDYIIGDKHVTPISDQAKFTEKIYQLKKIWECLSISDLNFKDQNIRKNDEKYVTFGSLVNPAKLNEKVINVWSSILNQTNNTKLFIKDGLFDIPEAREKFIKKFENNKVNENQLIIEGKDSRAKHIDSYNKVDIVLDTFPVSGATTSFEASYMGVPILTKINENSFWFRTGESINKNLNMNDWIAKDENDYVKKAIKFSENKKYLNNLKDELANFAAKSSLFDTQGFCDDFYEMLINIRR